MLNSDGPSHREAVIINNKTSTRPSGLVTGTIAGHDMGLGHAHSMVMPHQTHAMSMGMAICDGPGKHDIARAQAWAQPQPPGFGRLVAVCTDNYIDV